jgi:hypothetical protein
VFVEILAAATITICGMIRQFNIFRTFALTKLHDLEQVPKDNLLSTSFVKMVDMRVQAHYTRVWQKVLRPMQEQRAY